MYYKLYHGSVERIPQKHRFFYLRAQLLVSGEWQHWQTLQCSVCLRIRCSRTQIETVKMNLGAVYLKSVELDIDQEGFEWAEIDGQNIGTVMDKKLLLDCVTGNLQWNEKKLAKVV